jgi:hypothetical protein
MMSTRATAATTLPIRAALGNLDNTLREQVARSGSPIIGRMGCPTSAMIATQRRRLMPEFSWYRHRMCVFQEA